jgi:non-ribosomal peptide synthetase component E (peptide arylation enzyme)
MMKTEVQMAQSHQAAFQQAFFRQQPRHQLWLLPSMGTTGIPMRIPLKKHPYDWRSYVNKSENWSEWLNKQPRNKEHYYKVLHHNFRFNCPPILVICQATHARSTTSSNAILQHWKVEAWNW